MWDVTVTSVGQVSMAFNGTVVLRAACPALAVQGDRISACDASYYSGVAAVLPTTRGTDERFGNYTERLIGYVPAADAPALQLQVRTFDGVCRVVQMRLLATQPFATNMMSPLYGARWSIGKAGRPRLLSVPWDNDLFAMYDATTPHLLESGTSAYATAIYDDFSRRGLVVGFLEHGMWKSGIEYRGSNTIHAVAGINGLITTRDTQPHGVVTTGVSPWLSIGFYSDWRDGMEEFARSQRGGGGRPAPLPTALPTLDSRPLAGYNTWATSIFPGSGPNATNVLAASAVLAPLLRQGFGPQQFIDADADFPLSGAQRSDWRRTTAAAGQHIGGYMDPFVWDGESSGNVSCGGVSWPGIEVLLKDDKGVPIVPLEAKLMKQHKLIKDPTHPYVECELRAKVATLHHATHHTTPHRTTSRRTTSRHATPHHTTPHRTTSQH